jgi:hypothetical protein
LDTPVAAASPPRHPTFRRHPLLAGAFVALGILVYLIYILLLAYAFLGSGMIGFLCPGGDLLGGGESRLAFYTVCGVAAGLTRARRPRLVCALLANSNLLGPVGPLVLGIEIPLAFYAVCGATASLTRARWLRILCALFAHIGPLLFTDDHVIGALLLPFLAFSPAWAFLLLEGFRAQPRRDDIPKPEGKQAEAYQGPRCVACEEPVEPGAAQCQKCGWTQPL